VDIDPDLLADAMTATGAPTPETAIIEGLRLVVARERQLAALKALAGLGWEGDLDAMREGRDQAAAE
jgi:Arc/MetJ family transcription regulator